MKKQKTHSAEMLTLLSAWNKVAGRDLTQDFVYSSFRDVGDWMVEGSFCIAVNIPKGFCSLRAYVVVLQPLEEAIVKQWNLRLVSVPCLEVTHVA